MADIPTPRSFQTILGEMLDSYLSRKGGGQNLRVGSAVLSAFESAAQSDLRNTQDIFAMLDAIDLQRAEKNALDLLGAQESVPRLGAASSTGFVTIVDTTFQKTTSFVYTGTTAPASGSFLINVADGSSFPATGSIYIGRGTTNIEGPLAYSGIVKVATYWQITLVTPTTRFHNLNETVIVAKGGNRAIPAGTICRTPQGSVAAVQFGTVFSTVILDGETEADLVQVAAKTPGVSGNVPRGAITEVTGLSFTGSCTNDSPFDNGSDVETDADYRERIRLERQSRSKGTPLAIKTAALGVVATDESKRVVSANVVVRSGLTTVLYIDDGTGYEEREQGVPSETVIDFAMGGESLFQLQNRPVAKAFLQSTTSAPFALAENTKLSVKVGTVTYEHSFSSGDFRSIGNATAFEVMGSINGNGTLGFGARTAASGTQVALFSTVEGVEDIQIVVPGDGVDSNAVLQFPIIPVSTLKLFKNDHLLFQNGSDAVLSSAFQSAWSTIVSGVTLILNVDGTSNRTFTFTDADFANNNTGYSSVSALNSLASWAIVFNKKLTGVKATVVGAQIFLTSNLGPDNRASLVIDPTSGLVTDGMFTPTYGLSATGREDDYTFDRATGQIQLVEKLIEGDKLTVGSNTTEGYVQGTEVPSASVTLAGTAELYLIADGNPVSIVGTNLTPSTSITNLIENVFGFGTVPVTRWTATAGVFSAVQKGDWFVCWDPAVTHRGAWRVGFVAGDGSYFQAQHSTIGDTQQPNGTVVLTSNGFAFVRTTGMVQRLTVAAGTYNLDQVVAALNSVLLGAFSSTVYNDKLRVLTDTLATTGSMTMVGANTEGQKFLLPLKDVELNEVPHLAYIESGNTEDGTPLFTIFAEYGSIVRWMKNYGSHMYGVNANETQLVITPGANPDLSGGGNQNVLRPKVTCRSVSSATTDDFERSFPASLFTLSASDSISIVIDDDPVGKSYTVPMYRRIKPAIGQTYANTFNVVDADNGSTFLSTAFGSSFNFQDFAVHMRARVKTHMDSAANKSILWRLVQWGVPTPAQATTKIAYKRPLGPNGALKALLDTPTTIGIYLPSGAARTALGILNSTRFDVTRASNTLTFQSATRTVPVYNAGPPEVGLKRVGTTVTLKLTSVDPTDLGLLAGDVIYLTSTDPDFPSGAKTIVNGAVESGNSYTVTYTEAGSTTPGTNTIACTFTYSVSAPDFTNVQVGDICNLKPGSGFLSNWLGQWRVTAKTATTVSILRNSTPTAPGTVPTAAPYKLLDSTLMEFYPITSQTAAQIVTFANSVGSGLNGTVAALAVEDGGGSPGTGAITLSTEDEKVASTNNYGATSVAAWTFLDGLNYVNTLNLSTSALALKIAVTSDLVTNSDFANEEMRLVPMSAQNLVDWLSTPAVSGLYNSASARTSSRARKVQIASNTLGSIGAVQISSGSGNAASAQIVGTAGNGQVQVPSAQTIGFTPLAWVEITADTIQPKVPVHSYLSTTVFTVANVGGGEKSITKGDGNFFTLGSSIEGSDGALFVAVERHGRYVCLMMQKYLAISENDWVNVSVAGLSLANKGWFRVINAFNDFATSGYAYLWIDNPAAVEETTTTNGTTDFIRTYSYNSAVPGDTLRFPSNSYVVSRVHATNQAIIYVLDPNSTLSVGAITLGGSAPLYQLVEAKPAKVTKRVTNLLQRPDITDFTWITFSTNTNSNLISGARGSVMRTLDKPSFPTIAAFGLDGYSYNVGLIGEVSKVLYGVESDPVTYPGVAAAGTTIDIHGPTVKRVEVSLAIRVRSGLSTREISDRVKGSVASAINRVNVGQPLAIATIVAAAERVEGVESVVVLFPDYGVGSDLIAVQANEKPLVLNVDTDISISIIGV